MVGVKHQRLSRAAEHTHVHTTHAVHLHHILHTAGFLGYGDHGSHAGVLHLLHLDIQLVIVKGLFKQLSQFLGSLLELLVILFDLFLERSVQVRVNAQELKPFLFLLHMADEWIVNGSGHDDSVNALLPEHVDILALLLFIGHIEHRILMLFLVLIQAVLQGEVFAFQILIKDIIPHFLRELFILDITEFDEWRNIVPVLLIVFTVRLAHAGKLVSHLLGDIVRNLLYKTIVLQRASGNIKRQVRAVDDTL